MQCIKRTLQPYHASYVTQCMQRATAMSCNICKELTAMSHNTYKEQAMSCNICQELQLCHTMHAKSYSYIYVTQGMQKATAMSHNACKEQQLCHAVHERSYSLVCHIIHAKSHSYVTQYIVSNSCYAIQCKEVQLCNIMCASELLSLHSTWLLAVHTTLLLFL